MNFLNKRVLITIITIFFSIPLFSQLSGYDYYATITIDHSLVSGSTNHANFPVMIDITEDYLKTISNGGKITNPNGYDISFSNSVNSQTLDHYIEEYDGSSGRYVAWVKIPSLSSSADTEIRLYFSKSSVSLNPSATSTWNSSYDAVYFLNDDFNDKSGNNNNGTNYNSTDIEGKIANGQDFEQADNSSEQRIDCGTFDLSSPNYITLSGWFKAESFDEPDGRIISKANEWDDQDHYWMLSTTSDNGGMKLRFRLKTGSYTTTLIASSGNLTAGNWYYANAVYDGSNMRIYLNGSQVVSTPKTGSIATSSTTSVYIGNNKWSDPTHKKPFDGIIDHVSVSNAAHSADWIVTEYNNQNNPGTFFSVYTPPCPVFILGSSSSRCIGVGTETYTATNATNYMLSGGGTINPSTGEVTWNPAFSGTATITASNDGPNEATHTVYINNDVVGTPVFTLGSSSILNRPGGTKTYTATASNAVYYKYFLRIKTNSSLAGTTTINENTGEVNWDDDYYGTAKIDCKAYSGCDSSMATHSVRLTQGFYMHTKGWGTNGASSLTYNIVDSLGFSDFSTVDSVIVVATYKGSVATSSSTTVTFTSSESETQVLDFNDRTPSDESTGNSGQNPTIYRTTMEPAETYTVSFNAQASNFWSFLLYVYTTDTTAECYSIVEYTNYYVFQGSFSRTIEKPIEVEDKTIYVSIPFTEISNDNRVAQITASAFGGIFLAFGEYYQTTHGIALNIAELQFSPVPYSAPSVTVEVVSPDGTENPTGDSFITGDISLVVCPEVEENFLPISLVYFDARIENEKVRLNWITASETNNDYFQILKSLDGQNWETIGKVSGMGNSNEITQYTYFDEFPSIGTSYYRLKQIDFDGKEELSPIEKVYFSNNNDDIIIYPNPISKDKPITIDTKGNKIEKIKIISMIGETVLETENLDNNQIVLSLPIGIYLVEVFTENTKSIQKIQIIY